MPKRLMISLLPGILGAAILFGGLTAQAQSIPFLDLAVSPGSQNAAPGASPLWDLQFTNNNADTAYFVLSGFSDGLGSVPNIVVPSFDPVPFGQHITLAPNATLNLHSLFQTVVSPFSGSSSYTSTAEATYDLYDSSLFSNPLLVGVTASGDWTLNVTAIPSSSSVPEPGGIALFVGAGVAGGVLTLIRRKKLR